MIQIKEVEPIMIDVTDSQSTVRPELAFSGKCNVHFEVLQDERLKMEGTLEIEGTKEMVLEKELSYEVYLSIMSVDQY